MTQNGEPLPGVNQPDTQPLPGLGAAARRPGVGPDAGQPRGGVTPDRTKVMALPVAPGEVPGGRPPGGHRRRAWPASPTRETARPREQEPLQSNAFRESTMLNLGGVPVIAMVDTSMPLIDTVRQGKLPPSPRLLIFDNNGELLDQGRGEVTLGDKQSGARVTFTWNRDRWVASSTGSQETSIKKVEDFNTRSPDPRVPEFELLQGWTRLDQVQANRYGVGRYGVDFHMGRHDTHKGHDIYLRRKRLFVGGLPIGIELYKAATIGKAQSPYREEITHIPIDDKSDSVSPYQVLLIPGVGECFVREFNGHHHTWVNFALQDQIGPTATALVEGGRRMRNAAAEWREWGPRSRRFVQTVRDNERVRESASSLVERGRQLRDRWGPRARWFRDKAANKVRPVVQRVANKALEWSTPRSDSGPQNGGNQGDGGNPTGGV